jgi:hypothetical protein
MPNADGLSPRTVLGGDARSDITFKVGAPMLGTRLVKAMEEGTCSDTNCHGTN